VELNVIVQEKKNIVMKVDQKHCPEPYYIHFVAQKSRKKVLNLEFILTLFPGTITSIARGGEEGWMKWC
jgi:hypothetical protein